MKSYLVTSSVTFVPKNYNHFILKMAESPHVHGLIILENRSMQILKQALLLFFSRTAPEFGKTLLKNFFFPGLRERKKIFQLHGKEFAVFKNINDPDCVEYLRTRNPDLIINSRTRYIYKKPVLQLARLGCINIHHGLLPKQRGVMNDFWAHLTNESFGFSIHQMTEKIDDGGILYTQEVLSERKSYLKSIEEGSILEATIMTKTLDSIAREGLQTKPNPKEGSVYRKNPGRAEILQLKRKGIRI